MRIGTLFLVLLLGLSAAWADDLVRCPADNPNCTSSEVTRSEHDGQPGSPNARFVAPTIQEFYVPIRTASTVAGALFGSLRRQEKEIKAYWENRVTELEKANAQCFVLQGDEYIRECLSNVRQTEIRKSQLLIEYNQQMAGWTQAQSQYASQILQNAGRQFQQSRPVNTNCNTYSYGSIGNVNCTSY